MTLETLSLIAFWSVPVFFIICFAFDWIANLINGDEPIKAKERYLLKYSKSQVTVIPYWQMMLKANGEGCFTGPHPANDEYKKKIIADGGRYCFSSDDTFFLDAPET